MVTTERMIWTTFWIHTDLQAKICVKPIMNVNNKNKPHHFAIKFCHFTHNFITDHIQKSEGKFGKINLWLKNVKFKNDDNK